MIARETEEADKVKEVVSQEEAAASKEAAGVKAIKVPFCTLWLLVWRNATSLEQVAWLSLLLFNGLLAYSHSATSVALHLACLCMQATNTQPLAQLVAP